MRMRDDDEEEKVDEDWDLNCNEINEVDDNDNDDVDVDVDDCDCDVVLIKNIGLVNIRGESPKIVVYGEKVKKKNHQKKKEKRKKKKLKSSICILTNNLVFSGEQNKQKNCTLKMNHVFRVCDNGGSAQQPNRLRIILESVGGNFNSGEKQRTKKNKTTRTKGTKGTKNKEKDTIPF
ncbi:hypothetical protein M0813_22773 [Anaeramoeba flamelloides]|uniref:Uncharacterized protein n=1 Tax=Anaeramoeba flamelloides TaxID=1746091 RepID=A0ABQ8YCH6_9EUKA|nr:hypothetical protein M0813_22773 [Anaeramoeba flamelloides]